MSKKFKGIELKSCSLSLDFCWVQIPFFGIVNTYHSWCPEENRYLTREIGIIVFGLAIYLFVEKNIRDDTVFE